MEKSLKRKSFSLADKLKVIAEIESVTTQADVGRKLGINKSTITAIWKDRDRIKNNGIEFNLTFKKVRKCDYAEIDSSLLEWFNLQRARNIAVNGPLLKSKAEEIAQLNGNETFLASQGWLDSWKKRHGIVFKAAAGESAAVDVTGIEEWLQQVWPSLSAGFTEKDIFNADETGLFFRLLPQKTYEFIGKECHGGKNSKDRLTVLLCANADGTEKLKPLVIGKSARPRCFKNIHDVSRLPVQYESNTKAWMTTQIFQSWLKQLNQKMKASKRKILLVLDNCAPHVAAKSRLDHIKVVFLPPNATSMIQPLDRGIINSMKTKYRTDLTKKIIAKLDSGGLPKVDVLEAIYGIDKAWNNVSPSTITNCFRNSGLVSKNSNNDDVEEILEDLEPRNETLDDLVGQLNIVNFSFEDYVGIDQNLELYDEQYNGAAEESDNAGQEEIINADQGSDNDEPTVAPINSSQAFANLDALKALVINKGNLEAFSLIQKLENALINDALFKKNQSRITDFFPKST